MADGARENGGGERRGVGRIVVACLLVGLLAAAALVYALTRAPSARIASATTAPATLPSAAATAPAATAPAPKPKPPTTQYLDVIHANHPRMPQTRPMEVPLDLSQAARLIFREPVYLSRSRQDLWITRPDAPATEAVLARAVKEQSDQLALAVREEVAFVHWTPRDSGPWAFNLIVRRPDGINYDLVNSSGRRKLGGVGRHYHWDRALDWNEKVVVATDTGVSIFAFEPEVTEWHQELGPMPEGSPPSNTAEPQFLLDWQGLLAWMPWERGKTGGRGAARFVDGRWAPLGPEQGWPEKLLHLVPLFDGSVLQIIAVDADQVRVALASLEQLKVDEAEITKRVEALSDADESVRQGAYQELTRYGPSLAPVLERLLKDQDPEAQARLRQLIKSQVEPTLGGMTLLGDQLRVAARLADGGAVFYAEAGVMMPGDGDTPVFRTPAWLSVRPGQAVQLLDPPLTTDLNPDRSRIYAFESEWVVTNDARGPQRFVGNGFEPLLRKSELSQGFSEPVGIDRRGRWLFRRASRADALVAGPANPGAALNLPGSPPSSAPAQPDHDGPISKPELPVAASVSPTTPIAAAPRPDELPDTATLILDPTIPDPTPRLPVWVYANADTVGWDKDNWPVAKRGGAWALVEKGWRALRPKDKFFTKPEEDPALAAVAPGEIPAAGDAASRAPSAPAPNEKALPATAPPAPTSSLVDERGPLLLVDESGTRYHDGRTSLRVVRPGVPEINWPLPPAATGGGVGGKVYLVRTPEGLLFLFNQPGRVLRISPVQGPEGPFTVDATFTRNVPNAESVTRVWLDPAGRMVMAFDKRLAIMFPAGYIPPALTRLIPPIEFDAQEP